MWDIILHGHHYTHRLLRCRRRGTIKVEFLTGVELGLVGAQAIAQALEANTSVTTVQYVPYQAYS